MATRSRSSIRAWKIPWTEPGGLQFIGLQRDTTEWQSTHTHTSQSRNFTFRLSSLTEKGVCIFQKKKKGCFIASSIVFDITQTRNNPMSTNSRANKLVYSYGEMLYNYENEHRRQAYTWTPPDGQYQNQTDSTLCSQRWKSSIESAKTRPRTDCGSTISSLLQNSGSNWRK